MELKLPRSRVLRGAYLMVQRYLRHNVGIQSAALAFYLLFMLFPFLIFISALLGLLRLDVAGILLALGEILPRGVADLIEVYLTYVSRNPSPHLMVFGLVFSIYFPMRATNSLMRSVRTAYHLGPPRGPARHVLKTLLYTVMLIVTIAAALALMTVGDRILSYAVAHFRLPGFVRRPGRGCGFRRWRCCAISRCSFSTPWPRTAASPGGTSGPAPWRPWRRGWASAGCTPSTWTTSPTTPCSTAPSAR